jgi:hypothetical protein
MDRATEVIPCRLTSESRVERTLVSSFRSRINVVLEKQL